eukprot:gene12918-13081_t
MPKTGGYQRIVAMTGDDAAAKQQRIKVFDAMDANGNHVISLAEIDKFLSEVWPELNNPPAQMRSYKAADADNSGLIGRNEFRMLLKSIVFYTDLWEKFEEIDVNKDHRLGLREFVTGCHLVGGAKIEDPEKMFRAMDNNGGGYVLFDEFCLTMARKLVVDDGADDEMLAATIHGTKEVLRAGDSHHVRSGAWWHGRAKVMAMTKKNANGKKLRQQMFKRINEDGDDTITWEEASAFDNMDSCKMAYEAADRDGGGIGKKEVRLFLQYQVFYDDAWEIFADMDTNADGALSEQEFLSNLDLLGVKVTNPKMVYASMDVNHDGKIDLREFSLWLGQLKFKGAENEDIARSYTAAGSFFPMENYAALGKAVSAAAPTSAPVIHAASHVAVPAIMHQPVPEHNGNFFEFLAEQKIKDTVIQVLKDEEIEDFHTLAHFTKADFADIGVKAGPALKLIRLGKAQEGI